MLALVDRVAARLQLAAGGRQHRVPGGDGRRRSWRELFAAPDDDAIATATAALPADEPEPELAPGRDLAAGDVLVLVTDGVADPWRDGPTTVAPALAGAPWPGGPDPLELAQLADFSRQGCHDDRTMSWCAPAGRRAGTPGVTAARLGVTA